MIRNKMKHINLFKTICAAVTVILTSVPAFSQTGIDSILAIVAKNNKGLQAIEQWQVSKALEWKSGITMSDPAIEYDYYKESGSGDLFQHDLLVKQSIDFPTAYIKKKQLSELRISQSSHELTAKRQDILLEAKKICIQLIYLNRLQQHLELLNSNAKKLNDATAKKLSTGEGNQMELNKSKLQMLEAEKQLFETQSTINVLHQKLAQYNGGKEILVRDTVFQSIEPLEAFEIVEQAFEKNDPHRKFLEQQIFVSQKQLELSRAASFPKMELGYRYQSYPEQNFNGIHGGITIPLWENKNKVKFRKAELVYSDLVLQSHLNEHYFEIKQLYEKYQHLKGIINAYREVFGSINTVYLLSKAYNTGHISLIEYYTELNFYNTTYKSFLETEKEYYEVLAELNKYKL